jgi:FixJ family two-component response regulator
MPGINGLELPRRLAPKSLPVIFITAHDDPAVREKAIASGAAAYLQKPLNKSALISAIEMALANHINLNRDGRQQNRMNRRHSASLAPDQNPLQTASK